MQQINVRLANKSDIDFIVQFQLAMALETENLLLNSEILEKGVRAVFDDNTKGQYFVATIEEVVIASLLITYEWSDWRNSTVIWLQSVFVKPEYRKNGVFKLLYSHIYSLMQSNVKYSGIRLYVDKTNNNAMKVYQNVGMNGEHYQVFEVMR